MKQRVAKKSRQTKETHIELSIDLDARHGNAETRDIDVKTGLGFLDHMITALAFHAGWDLKLSCDGDLDVDDHHTVEDCAIVLGETISELLADKSGIVRFASAYAPLDEALARAVIDISGRPFAHVELGLVGDAIGSVSCENLTHFMQSFAMYGRFTLHVDVLRGANDHHRVEAAFKALALAMRDGITPAAGGTQSTKGMLA
mgnify:CR=1 FL=1